MFSTNLKSALGYGCSDSSLSLPAKVTLKINVEVFAREQSSDLNANTLSEPAKITMWDFSASIFEPYLKHKRFLE
jgi:hypothetical protein